MNALNVLEQTIASRIASDPRESWTATLLAGGRAACAQKFGEEAIEAVIAGAHGSRQELIEESADVIYHLLVMLVANKVSLAEVMHELDSRKGVSGITEKQSRVRQ